MTDVYAGEAIPDRRPVLHRGLIPFGACLLIAAFLSDFAYWRSPVVQWNNFSQWLLLGGLIMAGLSGIALVVDLILGHVRRISWPRLLAVAAAALLSLLNIFVHSRDAYTAVVPEGIVLSGIVAVILILVGVSGGWDLRARRPTALAVPAREIRR